MGTYTTNFSLYKPAKNDVDYVAPFATSMDTIDAKLISTGVKTIAAGDATPSVAGTHVLVYDHAEDLTITGLDDPVDGQVLTIVCRGSYTITVNPFFYASAGAFVMNGADTLTLVYQGGLWMEISRSANS